MLYSVILKNKGLPGWIEDSFFPGFVPERVIAMMEILFVREELGLCDDCPLDSTCHVIRDDGTKYCIALFHDAFKPKWKIKDLA